MRQDWICCQLGAREHFSVPRAVQACGALEHLITDLWVHPDNLVYPLLPRRVRERFHAELDQARVHANNGGALALEAALRCRNVKGWDRVLRRNQWFQNWVTRTLRAIPRAEPGQTRVLFSFAYTAQKPFKVAKAMGWSTVMGQIDAGPVGIEACAREERKSGTQLENTPPAAYWDSWREECGLADLIVVNSHWSASALQIEGVPSDKIRIAPLAYDPVDTKSFRRHYPASFTHQRPLRALFLGQVTSGKGAAAILGALDLLGDDEPVEVSFVGARRIHIEQRWLASPRVRWVGPVARSETSHYYRQADLFLFPTVSDGFGLTQLEAQSWKLPIVASKFCGSVVQDGVNGILLPEVSPLAIVEAVRSCVRDPVRLANMSERASTANYSLARLQAELLEIGSQLTERSRSRG